VFVFFPFNQFLAFSYLWVLTSVCCYTLWTTYFLRVNPFTFGLERKTLLGSTKMGKSGPKKMLVGVWQRKRMESKGMGREKERCQKKCHSLEKRIFESVPKMSQSVFEALCTTWTSSVGGNSEVVLAQSWKKWIRTNEQSPHGVWIQRISSIKVSQVGSNLLRRQQINRSIDRSKFKGQNDWTIVQSFTVLPHSGRDNCW
jgi:hypothetical protein